MPRDRPGRGPGRRTAARPRRPASHRRSVRRGLARRRRRAPRRSASRTPGPGRPHRSCGCSPTCSPSTTCSPGATRRPEPRDGCCSGSDEDDLAPVGARPRRRPPLAGPRRRRVGQEHRAARLPARGGAHPLAEPGAGGARRLPPVSARRGACLLPAPPPDRRGPGRARAGRPRDPPRGSAGGRAEPGGPASGAEVFVVVDDHDLVTTGQHSPLLALAAPARPGRRRRPAPRRRPTLRRCLAGPLRAGAADPARPRRAGPAAVGQPRRRVRWSGGVRPVPAPPGRGRLVTRGRGVQVVQLAWRPPAA